MVKNTNNQISAPNPTTQPAAPVTQVTTPVAAAPDTTPAQSNQTTQNGDGLAKDTQEAYHNFIQKITRYIKNHMDKIVVLILTFNGLRGIYNSTRFIMVEYPKLEQQLAAHHLDQTQVSAFANKAFIMIGTTILSMFFALRISLVQNKVAKRISTAVGVFLIVLNRYINMYSEELGSVKIVTQMSTLLVELVRKIF